MKITSKIKKTISVAGVLVMTSTGAAAGSISTPDEALDRLTGPNQPGGRANHSICVAVTPYFLSGWGSSEFFSLQIDGATPMSQPEGQCSSPNEQGKCERGYIKISSTVPIACAVPIAL